MQATDFRNHFCTKRRSRSYLLAGGRRVQPRALPKAMSAFCCSWVGTSSPLAIAKSCFSYQRLVWCRLRLSRTRCLSSSVNGFGDGCRPDRTSSPDVFVSPPSGIVFSHAFHSGLWFDVEESETPPSSFLFRTWHSL